MNEAQHLLEELFRRAGSQNLDAVLELWHPDGVLEDVTLGRTAVGKEDVTAYLADFFAAFSDLTYGPQQMITEGEHGVVVWQGQTRVSGPFFGFPPSPGTLTLRGCDVFTLRDGLISRESSWYGDAWLATRLSGEDAFIRSLMPAP